MVSSNWFFNLLGIVVIILVIYYYLYPQYKNRDIIRAQKEAREKEMYNKLFKIYQEYNQEYNQEPIITIPEPDVNDLDYIIKSYNPKLELPKEMLEKQRNKKDNNYFDNNDPLREVAIYSDFILRSGEYPASNSNDGTLAELL